MKSDGERDVIRSGAELRLPAEKFRTLALHTLVGAVIGVLVLHPMSKIVYWFEFKHDLGAVGESLWSFLASRFESAFILEMMPMSLIFSAMGGCVGLAFGLYHLALVKQQRRVHYLERELAEDIPALIRLGEGEHLEFKSSVRWDFRQDKINKVLELVIAKTLVGFMNHQGGNLLIGVADDGEVLGLENDYKTLKSKDRDGFALCITDIVINRIGADMCVFVHCVFDDIGGNDVCRVIVESVLEPVYLRDGSHSKYFLRAGNGMRELDAREAIAHAARH